MFTSNKPEYHKIEGNAQGTTYHITYEYQVGADLQPAIDALLQEFDSSLSTYHPTSLISRINRNETVATDSLFEKVFQVALAVRNNFV